MLGEITSPTVAAAARAAVEKFDRLDGAARWLDGRLNARDFGMGSALATTTVAQARELHALLGNSFEWVDDLWCYGRAIEGAALVNSGASLVGGGSAAPQVARAGIAHLAQPGRLEHVAPYFRVAGVPEPMVSDRMAFPRLAPADLWASRWGADGSEIQFHDLDDVLADLTGFADHPVHDYFGAGVKDTIARRALGAHTTELLGRSRENQEVAAWLDRSAGRSGGISHDLAAPLETPATREVRALAAGRGA